jgi:hypothetical protein
MTRDIAVVLLQNMADGPHFKWGTVHARVWVFLGGSDLIFDMPGCLFCTLYLSLHVQYGRHVMYWILSVEQWAATGKQKTSRFNNWVRNGEDNTVQKHHHGQTIDKIADGNARKHTCQDAAHLSSCSRIGKQLSDRDLQPGKA